MDYYTQWLGLPPGPRPPDHYALLGVERFADDAGALRAAADKQMDRLEHFTLSQDRAKRDACQDLMDEIAQAVTVLTDVKQKAAYDNQLRSALGLPQPAQSGPSRPKPSSPEPTSSKPSSPKSASSSHVARKPAPGRQQPTSRTRSSSNQHAASDRAASAVPASSPGAGLLGDIAALGSSAAPPSPSTPEPSAPPRRSQRAGGRVDTQPHGSADDATPFDITTQPSTSSLASMTPRASSGLNKGVLIGVSAGVGGVLLGVLVMLMFGGGNDPADPPGEKGDGPLIGMGLVDENFVNRLKGDPSPPDRSTDNDNSTKQGGEATKGTPPEPGAPVKRVAKPVAKWAASTETLPKLAPASLVTGIKPSDVGPIITLSHALNVGQTIHHVALSKDAGVVALVRGVGDAVLLIDTASGRITHTLHLDDRVQHVSLDAAASRLAAASTKHLVVIDLDNNKVLWERAFEAVEQIALSGDGQNLAVLARRAAVGADSSVREVVVAATGDRRYQLSSTSLQGVGWSAEGRLVGITPGRAVLFGADGSEQSSIFGPINGGPRLSLSFAAKGPIFAASLYDHAPFLSRGVTVDFTNQKVGRMGPVVGVWENAPLLSLGGRRLDLWHNNRPQTLMTLRSPCRFHFGSGMEAAVGAIQPSTLVVMKLGDAGSVRSSLSPAPRIDSPNSDIKIERLHTPAKPINPNAFASLVRAVPGGTTLQVLKAYRSPVIYGGQMSLNGQRLAYAYRGGVEVLDLATDRLTHRISVGDRGVPTLHISSSGRYLLIRNASVGLAAINLDRAAVLWQKDAVVASHMDISHDERLVAWCEEGRPRVALCDLPSGRSLNLPTSTRDPLDVAFLPRGRLLCTFKNRIELFSLKPVRLLRAVDIDYPLLSNIRVSEGGDEVVIGRHATQRVFFNVDATSNPSIRNLPQRTYWSKPIKGGRALLAGAEIMLWDPRTSSLQPLLKARSPRELTKVGSYLHVHIRNPVDAHLIVKVIASDPPASSNIGTREVEASRQSKRP